MLCDNCQSVIVLCSSQTLIADITVALSRAHNGSNIDIVPIEAWERELVFDLLPEDLPRIAQVYRRTPPSTHIPTLRMLRPARSGTAHASRPRARQNHERPRIVRRIIPE